MPKSKIARTAVEEVRGVHGRSQAEWARLSVRVAPELKRKLQSQAKRAGVPLPEWLRTRLEAGPVSPGEVRAFLHALVDLGKQIDRISGRKPNKA